MKCFSTSDKDIITIELILLKSYKRWYQKQSSFVQQQVDALQFQANNGNFILLLDKKGQLDKVIICVAMLDDLYNLSALPLSLPIAKYKIVNQLDEKCIMQLCLGWMLGAYQFTRYKKAKRKAAQLFVFPKMLKRLKIECEATYLVRDLINTPLCDMKPADLSAECESVASKYHAKINITQGKRLAKQFPAVYAVGKGGSDARFIEMTWGNPKHKKITLVGKGVCFDTGGYDLKSASGMAIMKKDMGGAAHVLALAQMIMALKLKCHLTVLIGAVENMVSAQAFCPGDVIQTRLGLSVEIGNTDAEGRLVLCDGLAYACEKKPDLLIDFATLTGAARVALGPEIATVVSNQDDIAKQCSELSVCVQDSCWPLPLYKNYRPWLNSQIADMNNHSSEPFAGAITAALFLNEFVCPDIPWLHVDTYGWNKQALPGRPAGGEAIGLRAVLALIEEKLAKV